MLKISHVDRHFCCNILDMDMAIAGIGEICSFKMAYDHHVNDDDDDYAGHKFIFSRQNISLHDGF